MRDDGGSQDLPSTMVEYRLLSCLYCLLLWITTAHAFQTHPEVVGKSRCCSSSSTRRFVFIGKDVNEFPEKYPACYDLGPGRPFEFGAAGTVRPLLKQTQLANRPLQVIYDANRDGYDAQIFHNRVDGKGASVVLAKARGQWFGGYNPRGWASLGGSRPSVAAFLFYPKFPFGWQKLRVNGRGGLACSRDEFNQGIYFGADALAIPLQNGIGANPRVVASRLGMYYETGPGGRTSVLPMGGGDFVLQELKVVAGVYGKDEDIPNSGGVTDLGLY